jgi:hypothetical protein
MAIALPELFTINAPADAEYSIIVASVGTEKWSTS